jgi:DNA polymerase-3 subunit delta'
MTVWDSLVGQSAVVTWLQGAAADATQEPPGSAMTHAWLVTGPAGSGGSTAAGAFAAALMCPTGGCGHCDQCVAALNGSHADVEVIRPEGVSSTIPNSRATSAIERPESITRCAASPR